MISFIKDTFSADEIKLSTTAISWVIMCLFSLVTVVYKGDIPSNLMGLDIAVLTAFTGTAVANIVSGNKK